MRTEPLRFVLLHYHILKNAGSTIEDILDRSFGANYRTIDTPERDACLPETALLNLLESDRRIKAVSSHQIHYPVPTVPGYLFFDLCFLRDPIDRIRSMYDYFREKPAVGDPVSEFANNLPLGEFVARLIEDMPWYIHDAQVNLLSNGIVNDCPSIDDLDRAISRMLRTSFLGVVDCFTESLVAGQYFLQPIFPELKCAEASVNVSGGLGGSLEQRVAKVRDACAQQTYERLLALSTMDLELLDRARAEIQRRCSLIPEQQADDLRAGVRGAAPVVRSNTGAMVT